VCLSLSHFRSWWDRSNEGHKLSDRSSKLDDRLLTNSTGKTVVCTPLDPTLMVYKSWRDCCQSLNFLQKSSAVSEPWVYCHAAHKCVAPSHLMTGLHWRTAGPGDWAHNSAGTTDVECT